RARPIVRVALGRRLARADRVVDRLVERLWRWCLAEMIRELIEMGVVVSPVQFFDGFSDPPMHSCSLGRGKSFVDRAANQRVREAVAAAEPLPARDDSEIDGLL